jgi:hypothetical protein
VKIKNLVLFALALLTSAYMQGQDLTESTFGKGLVNVVAKDSSFSLNFAARFQSLYTSEGDFPNNENFELQEPSIMIRRARLKFEGFAYTPRLEYKIELGLSNRDLSGASVYTSNAPLLILDAVVQWNFYGNFELWAGQTKLPGNRERVISSANMETVDRSLLNSSFNIDRDIGLQLHHFFKLSNKFLIREKISISQGEGRNITTGNLGGSQFTGKLEFLPFGNFADYSGADLKREPLPKLAVTASFDHNDNAVKSRSNLGTYMINDTGFFETDINTFFADAMFKYRGLSIMAEYARRTADDPFAKNSDGTLTGEVVNVGEGFNFQTGYLFKNNYQVLGRYTNIILDESITGVGIETQYTIGLSKYFVGHKLKIQTDLSLNDYEDNMDNGVMYRLQFDIHF